MYLNKKIVGFTLLLLFSSNSFCFLDRFLRNIEKKIESAELAPHFNAGLTKSTQKMLIEIIKQLQEMVTKIPTATHHTITHQLPELNSIKVSDVQINHALPKIQAEPLTIEPVTIEHKMPTALPSVTINPVSIEHKAPEKLPAVTISFDIPTLTRVVKTSSVCTVGGGLALSGIGLLYRTLADANPLFSKTNCATSTCAILGGLALITKSDTVVNYIESKL